MRYQAPATIDETTALLHSADGTARILAGGTDLIPQMQARRQVPELVVDIKGIPETRQITLDNGVFTVGAAVTGAEFNEHPQLKLAWPGVAEAFDLIGSTQIQGRATLGGNLCNASPAADSVPALIAAATTCRIAGPVGEREAAVEDIVISPGRTSLRRGEFIVSFKFPARPGFCPSTTGDAEATESRRSADAYLRLIPRTEMDIAVVGAAVALTIGANGRCEQARVALGAVGPAVVVATGAANILLGSCLDDGTMKRFSAAVRSVCRPINDKRGTIEYRTEVASVLACRSAVIAWQRAGGQDKGVAP